MNKSLRSLVQQQHGVVARRQLVSAGCPPGKVDELIRQRRLFTVARGVYRVPGVRPTSSTEAMVAVLRCGADARVVGERLIVAAGVALAPVRADGRLPFSVLVPAGPPIPANAMWDVRPDRHPALGKKMSVAGLPTWSIARNVLEAAAVASDTRRVVELVAAVAAHDPALVGEVANLAVRAPTHDGVRRVLAAGAIDRATIERARAPIVARR